MEGTVPAFPVRFHLSVEFEFEKKFDEKSFSKEKASDLIKSVDNILTFAIIDKSILFRRLYVTNNNVIFRADHKNIEDEIYKISDVKELWRVRYVFCKRIPEFSTSFEDKLMNMQQEILKMKAKIQ